MIEKYIKKIYRNAIRPLFKSEILLQRFKLLYFIWGYIPILSIINLTRIIHQPAEGGQEIG